MWNCECGCAGILNPDLCPQCFLPRPTDVPAEQSAADSSSDDQVVTPEDLDSESTVAPQAPNGKKEKKLLWPELLSQGPAIARRGVERYFLVSAPRHQETSPNRVAQQPRKRKPRPYRLPSMRRAPQGRTWNPNKSRPVLPLRRMAVPPRLDSTQPASRTLRGPQRVRLQLHRDLLARSGSNCRTT